MANRPAPPVDDFSYPPSEDPDDNGRPRAPDPISLDRTAEFEQQRAALLAQNAELQDRALRALAEAENAQRQAERAVSEARKYAVSEFGREMLTVWDNLQRTIAASESQPHGSASDALIEGVRATERMLTSALERFGLVKITALYAPFDPNLHEAVMEVDDPSRPPGTVATVLEDGFKLHDRLVRASRVAVVKRRAEVLDAQVHGLVSDGDASQKDL
jgi:molecular chaperone GrpE